ncbi:MAG: type IV pilin N-terminal domain-containing protein [Methanoregula sp.]|nr:type IV pilin N-terminal domain-containing protein [Methanoregula sp.]
MMRTKRRCRDEGVSPVVGVMLMLVVTIIIAAVVSAFAGGLGSSQQKAPQLNMETKIVNTGYYAGSGISMDVTGLSEPIPTKDIKIVTSWKARNGVKNTTTVLPNSLNVIYGTFTQNVTSPFATGPGVDSYGLFHVKTADQNFGNYTLTVGTSMRAYPAGAWGPSLVGVGGYGVATATYQYVGGSNWNVGSDVDFLQAVLGIDWNNLREGDIVKVRVIHTPSGKVIYDQDVAVRGA